MAIDPRIPLAVTPPEWNPLSFAEELDRERSSKLLQANQAVTNDMQKTAYGDAMLKRAADQMKDDPQGWDRTMSQLAQANVPGAAELVGKWSPQNVARILNSGQMTEKGYLQQELNAAAAPRGQQAAGALPGSAPDPFGGKSNEEVAKNMAGVQMLLQPIAGGAIRSKADLDQAVDAVVAAGHPEAARFKGMFVDGPLFQEQMRGLKAKLEGAVTAAQNRLSTNGVDKPLEPQPGYSSMMSEAGPVIQTSPLDGGKPSFEFAPVAGSANKAFLPPPPSAGAAGAMAAAGAAGAGNDKMIDAIGHYQLAPPSAAKNPLYRQAIMDAVLQKYPDYDEHEFPLIAKARQAFNTGVQGNSVRSINTSVNHLATMEHLVDALDNNDMQEFNRWANWFATQTGSSKPTNVETAAQIVGAEVVKGIVGGQNALADREEASHAFATAKSPEQLRDAIALTKELMAGQLVELRRQYARTTHRNDFDRVMLSPEAYNQLSRLVPADGASSKIEELDWEK